MNRITLNEDSPNTFEGSFTKDLVFSKMWLCQEIVNAMDKKQICGFEAIVVLGAWYGNIGLILSRYNIAFESLIINDINPEHTRISQMLLGYLGDRVSIVTADANHLMYQQPINQLLVINTSCNDINGIEWFDRIPMNSLVALQSRSDHESLLQMNERFPMRETLYLGTKKFTDPAETYHRHSKIGMK
jgi:hypothetical protein